MLPYFLKLDMSEWVDTIFWMFPILLAMIISPLINILSEIIYLKRIRNRKIWLAFFGLWAMAGAFIFAYAENISSRWGIGKSKNTLLVGLGMIGFTLLDIGNEMLNVKLFKNCIFKEFF